MPDDPFLQLVCDALELMNSDKRKIDLSHSPNPDLDEQSISEAKDKAVEIGARQLAVRGDLVTPRLLKEARGHDLQVVCWTVNHPGHMRLLVQAGVDGIISDYPDRLLELTRRKDGSASR